MCSFFAFFKKKVLMIRQKGEGSEDKNTITLQIKQVKKRCYELISMLTERNNMHDIDTWMFFKYFVKMWIAVYLVSNTFTITMAVFDEEQNVVNSAAGLVSGDTSIDISSAITDLSTTLEVKHMSS